MNENSVNAYRNLYDTDNPKHSKELILSTMFLHNRPLTFDQISEYSGVERTALGQYIGRDLIDEKLVYKMVEKGKSKKGNSASLYITKKYLHEKGESVGPLHDDPRNPFNDQQLTLF